MTHNILTKDAYVDLSHIHDLETLKTKGNEKQKIVISTRSPYYRKMFDLNLVHINPDWNEKNMPEDIHSIIGEQYVTGWAANSV